MSIRREKESMVREGDGGNKEVTYKGEQVLARGGHSQRHSHLHHEAST
jgi:hypothetical protein